VIIQDNFIFDTFIKLTSKTYPYGHENELVNEMIKSGLFPKNIEMDSHGNYFYKVGESRTIFASHLDTACKDSTSVTHVIDGDTIKTDGKTILGADDKAGVTVMLFMMLHNVPGLYYFFIGEEVGCVGSGLASKYGDFKGKYDRIISFDRRDVDSVITFQSSTRCCSDKFADALAKELNRSGLKYEKDDTGVYTDSAEFTDIIPECTNLSVGYYREHTHNESQDIKHLEKLAKACLKVDWENLPVYRDMKKTEYKSWSSSSYSSSSYKTTYGSSGTSWRNRDWNGTSGSSSKKSYGYHDDWYDQNPVNSINSQFEDEDDVKWMKKTRRSKKKSSRQFYDNGGELIEIGDSIKTVNLYNTHYDYIISKFCSEPLTFDELEIVKDQYLDMSLDSDRVFYTYLLQYINENTILQDQ
jgi:hypothetical protein